MYQVSVWYEGEMVDKFVFDKLVDAKEKNRQLLAIYLTGYGITWDEMDEDEHEAELLKMSYGELKELEAEALVNKELDYTIKLEKII